MDVPLPSSLGDVMGHVTIIRFADFGNNESSDDYNTYCVAHVTADMFTLPHTLQHIHIAYIAGSLVM